MLKETSYNVYRQAITFEKLSLFFLTLQKTKTMDKRGFVSYL